MWVVESTGGKVACVTAAGVVTRVHVAAQRGGRDHPRRRRRDVDRRHGGEQPRSLRAGGDVRGAPAIEVFPLGISVSGAVDIAPAPTGNDLYVAADGALVRVQPTASSPTITSIALGNGKPAAVHSNATGVWWVDSVNKRIGRYAGDDRDRVGAAARQRRAERVHAGLGRIGLVHEQGRRPARALLRGDRSAGRPQGNPGATGAQGHRATGAGPPARPAQGTPGATGGNGRRPARPPGANGATPLRLSPERPARAGPAGPAGARGATGAQGRPAPPARAARPGRRPRSPRSPASSRATRSPARSAAAAAAVADGGSGGTNTGGGEGLRLRLSRSSKLYATGSRAASSKRARPSACTRCAAEGRQVHARRATSATSRSGCRCDCGEPALTGSR